MTKKNKKIIEENGITFGMISVIIMAISIVLILTTIKIYLSNQIYYESKVVNKLKAQSVTLEQNVEAIKYKNEVADTIFVINNKE